ncbi:MAG: NAD(P)H-binding protein [Deltaproteobacteria bacterium]|nr:NAD(P)H-binding protein [Deltaproteobacteria bacterium]
MIDKTLRVLVTGATGFVGQALLPALIAQGHTVRATTRDLSRSKSIEGVEWVRCDVNRADELRRALEGIDAVFFLVHAMGSGSHDYVDAERRVAESLRDEAAQAGVKRMVYLGGVAPAGAMSEHLKSRLAVGEVLRSGPVPTLELRASMIIGNGSASWQIVRDLAMRLPAMLLPSWTSSRTCPIALDDVIVALVRALDVPAPRGVWYDIPGPDVLSGRQILSAIAALKGRRVPGIPVPFLSVSLSSWWLKLVTRADFSLARELVLGFKGDLLPTDDRYWTEIDYRPQWTFEAAAKRALAEEELVFSARGIVGKLEETVVQLVSPKLRR